MTEPKFEISDKLYENYTVKFEKKMFGGGIYNVEGENKNGKFSVTYEKGEQNLKHSGAKCLNWRDVTFE